MASSSPTSDNNKPTEKLYYTNEPHSPYTSEYDTSLENSLSHHTDQALPTSLSSETNNPRSPFDSTTHDLHRLSAPNQPVYINMGVHEHSDGIQAIELMTTTTDQPISRSATTTTDIDNSLVPALTQRPSYHHHHHFPHHQQNRNRYPYLQRSFLARAYHRPQAPSNARDFLSYYDQRPAFRRSYFALRRQRIPKAPPMPKHLFPGFKQNRTSTKESRDDKETEDDEDQTPKKSFWIILRLVFFFFAIEFMYAVETALTVPILTSLRVPESLYSMAWLISPILGFFLQPIIGMWSDTCKCRWGRRRPFILAFAIGAYFGVALLLNSSDLGVLLGDPTAPNTVPYKAIVLTAIGVTFLDFCADSADAPVRAYLIDTTNTADQERGFNIHAILGVGGGLGFIVGAINWPYIPMAYKHGGEFSVVFYFASFLFIVCSIATLTSIPEVPLISSSSSSSSRDQADTDNPYDDDQREIDLSEKRPLLSLHRNSGSRSSNGKNKNDRSTADLYLRGMNSREGFIEIDPATGTRIPHDDVEMTTEDILLKTMERSHEVLAASLAASDPSNETPVSAHAFETELMQKAKLVKLGLLRRDEADVPDADDFDEKDNVTLKSMIVSMLRMPPRLWKLMICQVIGWIAYFATHLYFTDFVATAVYNGTLEHGDDAGFERYKKGVTMGCWGLFLYSSSTAVYAFCLERWLSERFSLKLLYFVGYLVYAVGCLVNFFVHNIVVNIIMCITFGMLVVSLNTLPYHMLAQFHADETYKNKDGSKRGIGVDCSLLNACYFLGELVVAASLGPILERTGVNYCMIVGSVFSVLGIVCMFFLFLFKK